MTGQEFLKFQIGSYVTDKENTLRREDFCCVQQFDRMGRVKLQPLDRYGRPKDEAFWVHFKDYDIQDKMLYDEFFECTTV